MNFIEKFNFEKLTSFILGAEKKLFLSLPGIDDALAMVLLECKKQIEIKIVFDNSEDSIRNGYGESEAIDKLRTAGVELKECNGNLVSFIICDDSGYFLFPFSKVFLEDPIGPNAVPIDPMTIQLLLMHYFPTKELLDCVNNEEKVSTMALQDHYENIMGNLQYGGITPVSKEFDEKKYEEIKKRLELNKPLTPDIRRQINTYTAKIQFVELKFTGGNLENHIATLPKDAIPINSDELKQLLNTRIKMFQDINNNPEYKKFLEFKKKIEELRKKYLTPITCRPSKSILQIFSKEDFKKDLKKCQDEAATLNEMLYEMLEKEKMNTKKLVRKELISFFDKNPPEELNKFKNEETKKEKLQEIIEITMASIKFPETQKLIDKISLTELYYDLTWNDFSDLKLLDEFAKKKIMSQSDIASIVEKKKAFDVKK